MARTQKQGLDYFPLDVIMDEKVELIEAKYDLVGFAVIVKLYQKIYANGYFLNVTDETLLLLAKRINVNINQLNAIINDCLHYGIFDKKLFEDYKILTSKGIQARFLEAIIRRKNVDLFNEYLLMSTSNYKNVTLIDQNVDIGTQSKVKESIVKESKRKQSVFTPPTIEEVKEYFSENGYNEETANKMFKSYSVADWHDSKGNKIKNWKQKAINVWFTEENKINKSNEKTFSNNRADKNESTYRAAEDLFARIEADK